MQIKFKAPGGAIQAALSVVSIVAPRPITPQGGSGYLFVVRGDRCYLYSRDVTRVARADFAIERIEGEGAFIYPAENVGLLERAGDGDITFTATSEGDTHRVSFLADSGAKDSRATYDPRLMTPCDKDVESATEERVFCVGILKEALRQAKPFLLDGDKKGGDQDRFKAAQIMDATKPDWAKGDGYLYAADGVTSIYFESEAFLGRSLHVHGQHFPALTSFLGRASGEVRVRKGQNMSFAIDDKGRVFGWAHHNAVHGRFIYYGFDADNYVFDVPVSAVLSALKYMQSGLGSKRDKIKLTYDAAQENLTFYAIEGAAETASFPVPVVPRDGCAKQDLSFFVNIHHLIAILGDAKGDRLMMRISNLPKNEVRTKDTAMVRTVDFFLMDADGKVVPGNEDSKPEGAYLCRVTRFLPSYN